VTTPAPANLVVAAPAPHATHRRAMWIGIGVGVGVLAATGAVLLGVFLSSDPLAPYPGNVSPHVVGINP
jgi:threonine/homoserine/homoserine lactone efflux protein